MCDKCVPHLCEHCFNPVLATEHRRMTLRWEEGEPLFLFVHGDCFEDYKIEQEAKA